MKTKTLEAVIRDLKMQCDTKDPSEANRLAAARAAEAAEAVAVAAKNRMKAEILRYGVQLLMGSELPAARASIAKAKK